MSVHFSSVQDGIYALGKAHMRPTPSLRSFPNGALETVPMLVWLTMALFSSSQGRSLSASSFYIRLSPLGDRWCDVLGFVPSGSLKLLNGCFSCQSLSFPLTPSCPGQYTQTMFRRWMSNIDTCQSGLPVPLFTFCSRLNVPL